MTGDPDFLAVELRAREDAVNDDVDEFDGHFADDVCLVVLRGPR